MMSCFRERIFRDQKVLFGARENKRNEEKIMSKNLIR